MKNYIYIIIALAISFFACKEEPIVIPPLSGNNGGGNVTTLAKKVLVEEYTGAGCVNCPDGALVLNDLKSNTYKENLIVVSVHAGFFTKKSQLPKESKFDFTTPKGNELQTYLGEPVGYPAAVINRKVRDATTGSLVTASKDQWAGIIQADSKETASAKIEVSQQFDATKNTVNIEITIEALSAITGTPALSVMLLEDNVVDAQKTPTGIKVDYVHRHVLRDMITPAQGTAISEPLTKGAKIKKSFSYTLPAAWVAKNCEIVAILHQTGNNKEVIQAEAVKVF
jgi:hypothetical protein